MTKTFRGAWVVGATTGLGRALADRLARLGAELVISGRDREELQRNARDLQVRHKIRCQIEVCDLADEHCARRAFEGVVDRLGERFDTLVLSHGAMAERDEVLEDPQQWSHMVAVNLTVPAIVLEWAARHFERLERPSTLCAITSVAGDRGRGSNYPYGATKAAFSTYLQGLRHRLAHSPVRVLDVKPGFLNTSMTWGLVRPDSPLMSEPERVAESIVGAMRRGRGQIYAPGFWRIIMGIVRAMPEPVFHRTRL